MSQTPERDPAETAEFIEATRLESIEEIRHATGVQRTPTFKEQVPGPVTDVETSPFRPQFRPPIAALCIIDDVGDEGEWIRIRADQFAIGRTEGDLLIPHDNMISGRHAELTRKSEKGRVVWYLTDLQSTNGTYVRVVRALLKHNQQMLIGGRRYRFDAALPGDPAATAAEAKKGTRDWQAPAPAARQHPCLVELTPRGEGQRYPLADADNWIGRVAGQCSIVLENDPMVDPRHARIFRDSQGRWYIENNQSLNGTWIRVTRVPFLSPGQFQLGEQRFLLRVG
jgi:pSer/pThr/pTyr-binding forkhead associated (FHA) protein